MRKIQKLKIVHRIKVLKIVILFIVVFSAVELAAQTLTLHKKDASIMEVFQEIRKQSGYNFVVNDQVVRQGNPINVSIKNIDLKEALDIIFKGQPFKYNIRGKIIYVVNKGEKDLVQDQILQKVIKGVIVDRQGKGISGVTIGGMDTKVAIKTLNDGSFELELPSSVDSIYVRCIGFKGVTRSVTNSLNLGEIILEESVLDMDQVVITGIYTRNKDSFTGSTSTFNKQELKNIGNQNVIESLKTLDPSFNIVENNMFGSDPNRLPDLEIRGKSSIVGLKEEFGTDPNQPLFILDGFEVPIRTVLDLNMNRIESLTILKDAASTAIYGSRAANGVIVIETIKPKAGELRLSYSNDLNLSVPDFRSYNLMNASEKLEFERLAGRYNYLAAEVSPQGQRNLDSLYNERLKEINRGVETDWLMEPVRNALTHGHNIYADGGTESFRFGLGLNYKELNGVMRGSGRKTVGGNIDLNYRKNSLTFSNKTSLENYTAGESPYGQFSSYSRANPYYRKFNAFGEIEKYLENSSDHQGWEYTVSNPLWNAQLRNRDDKKHKGIRNNFILEWDANSNLKFRLRSGLSQSSTETEVFVSPDDTQFDLVALNQRGRYENQRLDVFSYEGEFAATFGKIFNNVHLINAIAGWNFFESDETLKSFSAIGFPSGSIGTPAFSNMYPEGGKPNYRSNKARTTSFFSNFGYAYDNRYLLDFSYRADGSSVFGSNRLFTNTWSVGLAWNAHNESWIQLNDVFEMFKIRGSIGNPGNQNFSSFQSFTTYGFNTSNSNQFGTGAILEALGDPNLKWQKTVDMNVGMDVVLVGKRLRLNFDIYDKETNPLLAIINTPTSMGFPSMVTNFGSQKSKGAYGQINYSPIYKPNQGINWTVGLSARHEKSQYRNLGNLLDGMNNENKGINLDRYYDGGSPTSIWAVPSLGIDPMTGKEIFIKRNGDKTFDHSFLDEVVVGDSKPKWEGVLSNTVYYKNFNLGIHIRCRLGGQMFNEAIYDKVENISIEGLKNNQDKRAFYDRWKEPGDVSSFKGISLTELTPMSSRFVQDDNNIIGESFSIGYDMYDGWIKQMKMNSLNVRLYFNEFFRISTIKTERGIDYPFARSASLSVNLTF